MAREEKMGCAGLLDTNEMETGVLAEEGKKNGREESSVGINKSKKGRRREEGKGSRVMDGRSENVSGGIVIGVGKGNIFVKLPWASRERSNGRVKGR